MSITRDVLIELKAKVGESYKNAFSKAKKHSSDLRSSISGTISQIKSAAIFAGVISGPFVLAAREAMGFEKAMAEVSTLVDTSKVNMSGLNREIKKLAIESGTAPKQLAQGLYQMISAGVDASEAMDIMTVASKASIAGVAEQKQAVDLITNAINAYGLSTKESGKISDIAFTTVKLGKTTFGELADTMGRVMPTANLMNVSLEELYSSVATLTKTGLKTEEAVVRVNALLVEMLNPSKDLTGVIRKLGYESTTAAIKQDGFNAVMQKIKSVVGDNTQGMAKLFGNVRSLGGALAITSTTGAKEMTNILKEMNSSAGATDIAFGKMANTADHKLNRALSAIRVSGIEIGSKIIPILAKELENASNKISEWIDNGDIAVWSYKIKLVFVTIKSIVYSLVNSIETMYAGVFKLIESYYTAKYEYFGDIKDAKTAYEFRESAADTYSKSATTQLGINKDFREATQDVADAMAAREAKKLGRNRGANMNNMINGIINSYDEGIQEQAQSLMQQFNIPFAQILTSR